MTQDELESGPEPSSPALPPLPGGLLARHRFAAVLVAVLAAAAGAAVAVAALLLAQGDALVRAGIVAGLTLAVSLVAGVVAAAVARRQRRAIGEGLARLAEVVADATVRDDGARARIAGDDELARLGAGLDALLDRQLERAQQRAADEARLRAALASLAARIDEVARQGNLDLPVAAPLADGPADETLAPVLGALGRLLQSASRWIDGIAEASREVAEATVAVRSHADQCRHAGAREQDDALLAARDIGLAAVALHRIGEAARTLRESEERGARAVDASLERVAAASAGLAQMRDGLREAGQRIKVAGERATALSQVAARVQSLATRADLLALNASMQAVGADESAAVLADLAHEVERLAEIGRGAAAEGVRLAEALRLALSRAGEAADEAVLRQADAAREVEAVARGLRDGREHLDRAGEEARRMVREAEAPTESAPRLEEQARRIDDARIESLRLLDAQADEARRLGAAARALLDRVGSVRPIDRAGRP